MAEKLDPQIENCWEGLVKLIKGSGVGVYLVAEAGSLIQTSLGIDYPNWREEKVLGLILREDLEPENETLAALLLLGFIYDEHFTGGLTQINQKYFDFVLSKIGSEKSGEVATVLWRHFEQ